MTTQTMTLVTIIDQADFDTVKERFLIGKGPKEADKVDRKLEEYRAAAGNEWKAYIIAELDEIIIL